MSETRTTTDVPASGSVMLAVWQGEFGHLLLNFAPAVRHLSRSYGRTIVALDASTAHIVEDFADEIVPLKCQGHAGYTGKLLEGKDRLDAAITALPKDGVVVTGRDLFSSKWKKNPPREHREYGRPPRPLFDAICFFRPPKLRRGDTNPLRKSFPEEEAARLVELLVAKEWRVGCAGGPDNRTYPGALDLRGIPLEWLCHSLRGAGVAIGPSSGPMHLASICGCPHVVWCDHANMRKRYEVAWNPFRTPVKYLVPTRDGNLNPEVEDIVAAAERIRTR